MQDLPSLKDQLSSRNLFDAFKVQLAKDFEQGGFSIDFIETLEPDYNTIHEKIAYELQRKSENPDCNLMQLLYRVDISEAQLQKYFHRDKDQNHFNVVAELIIKRVLQKVVLRQFYKSNLNSKSNQDGYTNSGSHISSKAID